MISGFYYLHENGDLIFKVLSPDDDSDFVKKVWVVDFGNRLSAWILLLEALQAGARIERVRELAGKWHCTAEDLTKFLVGNLHPTDIQVEGLYVYLRHIANVDPDQWLDWLAATPKGGEPDFVTMPRSKDI